MALKRCPHCGGTKFLAKVTRGGQVESQEDGNFKITMEGQNAQIEIVNCANKNCKAQLSESNLIEMVPCKKCGTLTAPENLDENGECDICKALVTRPDLANASKEDLIRMFLSLEKTTKNNSVENTLVAQVTEAPVTPEKENIPVTEEKVVEKPVSQVAQSKMEAAQQAMKNVSNEIGQELDNAMNPLDGNMNAPEEPTTEEEQPVKKRKRRKSTDEQPVEQVTTAPTKNEVKESTDAITNSQQAPFPTPDAGMQDIFNQAAAPVQEEQTTQQEQQPQQPFQMFEQEQSF